MILNRSPDFNLYKIKISKNAIDFINRTLEKNPKKRIKITEIKEHIFFQEIEFEKLINYKIKAPFIPDIV